MGRTHRSDNSFKHSTYMRLVYALIILCLMGPLLLGIIILILSFLPILFAFPALWMGWKLVEVCVHWQKGMALELKARKSSMPSANVEIVLPPKSYQDTETTV